MGRNVHLNYDELGTIVKKFRDEGEDVVQMQLKMRDRVQALHKDWVGQGADKFFNEMENDMLPALTRLAGALFYAQDVLNKIIKTIQTFDEDTAGYFKVDFAHLNPINLGAFLAGAGVGAGIGNLTGAALSGGPAGSGPGDSTGGTGGPLPDSQTGSGQAGSGIQTPGAGGQPQTAGSGVGGGAGVNGGSGQGIQGSLGSMTGGPTGQSAPSGSGSAAGGGSAGMQDHIFGSSSAGGSSSVGSGGGSSGSGSGAASGDGSNAAGSGNASAAGVADAAGVLGVAGAVAGGANAVPGGVSNTIKGKGRKKRR
jgi:WXG100 family type VII secretion target